MAREKADWEQVVKWVDWGRIEGAREFITLWADDQFGKDRDPQATLTKLVLEEIPELLTHKKEHGLNGLDTEFADTLILLLDLASLWGINVPKALEQKMTMNVARTWKVDKSTGFYNHVEDEK
jgi:NTP pyrophosphatase (non-canonical NTP hydrolase)